MSAVRPLLQFSHANGFPAACYRQFLDCLEERFEVRHVPCFGHDPAFPVTDGWHRLTDQLIHAIETHRRPVIAVGHSLGAYLSLRAGARRPDLIRAIVMLDAPILSRFQGGALAITKRLGLAARLGPAPGAKFRRREWDSPEAALAHFRTREVFRRFDPRCLEDYVRHGLRTENGVSRLLFDPEVEHRIYQTLPHDLARDAGRLTVPAGLIVGRRSDIARRVGLGVSSRTLRVASTRGGHLFPFQYPEQAARAVLRMLGELGCAT